MELCLTILNDFLGSLASLVHQNSVKNWADTLEVEYKVVDNFVRSSNISSPSSNSNAFDFFVKLRNTGSETISSDLPWAIYFYQDQGEIITIQIKRQLAECIFYENMTPVTVPIAFQIFIYM